MRWVFAEEWPSEGPPPWGLGEGSDNGAGAADPDAADATVAIDESAH
jgi:hypothetical protein